MSAAIEAAMAAKLQAGQTIQLHAGGDSMGPGWEGLIEIAPLRKGEPNLGQVLLIEGAQGWILHRLLWKRKGQVLTRGDKAKSCDPWMELDQIRGIARSKAGKPVGRGRGWVRLCMLTLFCR